MDFILILAQFLLYGLSLLGVGASDPGLLDNHMVRITVAIAVTLIASRLSPSFTVRGARLLYLVSLALLVLVLVIGNGPGGVRRWFDLPGGLAFQPSELMKVAMIIYLAAFFHQRGTDYPIMGPVVAVGAAAGLVLVEPDFATGLLLLVLAAFLLVVIGVPWRRLVAIGTSATLVALAFSGAFLGKFNYIQERYQGYLDCRSGKADPAADCYQVLQGQKAILRAGFFGQGPGSQMPHLPESHNDMVLASVIWAGGWMSGLMVLIAYGLILARGLQIAANSEGAVSVLAVGLTAYLCLQAALNIGVVLGILPVTGVPLPMVSFGGSSMLVSGAALGLLHALSRQALRAEATTS